ncbi:DNA internalization-related competence protein ComEC/Rec2 [Marinobacter nitratireducens]|nr:DNA internalization-related competence protein ComEC/Rec2 [Marinobacter nitratireducens]
MSEGNYPCPGSPVRHGLARLGIFAFACGAILLYRLSVLPPWQWLIVSIITVFLIFIASRSGKFLALWCVVLGLAVGLGWAGLHSWARLAERMPPSLEGQRLAVSGYLCDVPSVGSFHSVRFSFCVTEWHVREVASDAGLRLPSLLRLSWYGASPADLPGRRLRLEVTLKRPHGTLNSAGFRYEDWLFRKGYRATGSVKSVAEDLRVPCGIRCTYQGVYAGAVSWVNREFGDADHFPLIASLIVGYRGYLDDAQWDVLKATGTIHLVAISGLHLGLVALGAGFIARRLFLLLPGGLMSESGSRSGTFALVLLCCLLYALTAGFTVPTQRALVMVAVASWSVLLGREQSPWLALLMALVAVLLLDPFAPLDQGFWLSFGAVSVLVWSFAGRFKQAGWLKSLLIAQCAIFAGLWPVLALQGQGQPLMGAVANLLAIPWVSLVVMPVLAFAAAIAGLVPDASADLIPVVDAVLGSLWFFLDWAAFCGVPELQPPDSILLLLAPLVLLIVIVPWGPWRVAGVSALCVWFLQAPEAVETGNPYVSDPEVHIWDVGQGLSVLVRHQRDVLLYDTGPAVPGVFSSVESTLLPSLAALGVRRIDTLVVSHGDNDHSGGLQRLVEALPVGAVVSGEPGVVQGKLSAADIQVSPCEEGESRTLGRLTIRYWRNPVAEEGNDASCVVTVLDDKTGAEWILPGDITGESETAFLQYRSAISDPSDVSERLVLAPHHGSKTSSTHAWVETLSPDYVIYSAGYHHRFGHPHPDVVARYRESGAVSLNTACSGMIMVRSAANRMILKEIRDQAPFWISAPGLTRDDCKIP